MTNGRAAGLIIGNEVLTAKVEEANGAWLTRRLRERNVPLAMLVTVPDDVDAIVEAMQLLKRRAQWVITSGGVGPTHDDVTVRAVAMALGRRVVRLAEIEEKVRAHYGERLTPESLRLADAPEGSELLHQAGRWFPVLACSAVYLLPGVPELFRIQLETVLTRLPVGKLTTAVMYLSAGEPEIARALDAVALAMPEVPIGSYPNFDESLGYRVKVTIEHAEAGRVAEAVRRLTETLPSGCILRRE
ncbi:MAG: competence/damage-inducible protein A [Archangiaceae bacterium]|nr:competence/damage-inducible protein A [Archangiaceae bacterium]